MLQVLQGLAGTFFIGYLFYTFHNWVKKQNLVLLNADPATYIFGRYAEKIITDTAVMLFCVAVFSSFGLTILAWSYITYFMLKWLKLIFIYGHVTRLTSQGKVLTAKPIPAPRVNYYA